jgi:hypothetical protein
MAQPNSDHVVSTPNVPGQNNYDAASTSNVDRWRKLDGNSGALSINTGRGGDHFAGAHPDPHWTQT